MSIARGAIDRPLLTWLLMIGCLMGGVWGFLTIGRLEDPSFTIKNAIVITQYPGATAEEVAREVSEPLESAIQQMDELDTITSSNKPGISRINVEIADTYDGSELPQVWDRLRARVEDARGDLPPDAGTPLVNDAFGDVYGIFFAVSAPGFTDAETHDIADFLRRELLTVEGVADVALAGLPQEAIFVEPDPAIISNLGLSPRTVTGAISDATAVVPAGTVEQQDQRIRIDAPSGSTSVDAIRNLTIGVQGEIVDLSDFATVSRGRVESPSMIIRYDGQEA